MTKKTKPKTNAKLGQSIKCRCGRRHKLKSLMGIFDIYTCGRRQYLVGFMGYKI